MAGSVKGITVQIGADTTQLTTALRAIKAETKGLDSSMKKLKSSMSYNGTDTRTLQTFQTYQKGLSTQMNGLTKQINVQKKALDQWGNTVHGWELGLNTAKNNISFLEPKMKSLRSTIIAQQEAVEGYSDRISVLNNLKTQNGKLTSAQSRELSYLTRRQDEVATSLTANQKQYAEWDRQLKANRNDVTYFTSELENQDNTLTKLETDYASNVQQLRGMATELVSTSEKGQTLYYGLEKASKGLDQFSKATRTLSIISGATIVGAVMAAISFEDAWTGVTKTVEGTPEQLKAVNDGLKELAVNTSSSYEDIAHYAELAGQMGVATDAVVGFTKTITMLGDTTNLVGEDAAQQIAKFANIMVSSEEQTNDYYERLGSTIVDLGNNFATTEADIMNMSMRMATAGKQAGFSSQEVLALSTTLSSLGLRAQEGGSSMSKMLQRISLAVATNSEELQAYAEVAGMTADEFSKAWGDNAANAFLKFLQGIQNSENELVKLNDLGLANEVRLTRAMGSLATNTDLYASALDTANSAWMENTAMVNEAEKRYATLKSQLSQTWEAIKQAGNELGQALTPALSFLLGVVKNVALWFSKLDDSTQQTIATMLLVGAAISPVTWAMGKLMGTGANLIKTFTGVNRIASFFASKMGLAVQATQAANFALPSLQASLVGVAEKEGKATTSILGLAKAYASAHPVIAGMSPIVAGLTLMWIDNARHLRELKKETQEYLSENSEAYNSVKQATTAFEQYSESYKGHKEAIQGIKDGYETNAVAADQYVKTISRLNGMEHLSLLQKAELRTALEGLKTIFPELGYNIDETTGKVVDETGAVLENTDALKENVEAYKQAAKEKAYIDALSEYSQAIAESELQVKKLSSRYGELIQETNEAEKAYQKALEVYGQDKSNENWKALEDAQAKFQELANATGTAGIEIAEANKNIRDSVQGMMETVSAEKGIEGLKTEFESMATVAKDSGYEITAAFAQSIRDGSVDMNDAVDFLSSLMSFQEIVDEAGEYGGLIDSGLADSMINNAPTIQEATTNLNNLIDFTNAVETSGLKGSELVNRLVANIQSGHISVQDATNLLMSGSVSEIESAVNEMEAEAARAPIGVARGISSGDTSSAGSALIGGAKSSVIGGLRDMENAASSTANAISGILSGINMAIAAAAQKASSISVSANKGRSFDDYVPYMDRASDLYYARDLGNAVDTSSISYVGASTIVPNGGTIGGYTSYASATLNTGKIDQLINALNSARLVINLAPAQVNGRTLYEAVTEETTIAELLNGYGKGLANV